MRSVRDRVVIVTGASAGIGRTTAHRLVAHGATVVAAARDADRLADVARAVADLPGTLDARRCDVTVPGDRVGLVDGTLARYGRVDGLVNNAGVGWTGLVEDMDAADVERLYATNVVAVVDLTRLVLPYMLERGDGDIVVVSSLASFVPAPPLTAYSSTKTAVDGFVAGLRREVWRRGIRVHTVHPAPVRTEWLARAQGYRPGGGDPEIRMAPGVPAEWVAAAVERSLTRPWPRSASVPRVAGVARLLAVQPLRSVVDVATAIGVERLGAGARRSAAERDPAAERSAHEGSSRDA